MGRKPVDLTGERFGCLVVVGRSLDQLSKNAKWSCKCDCGNISTVESQKLRSGKAKSCGCKRNEYNSKSSKTHGMTRTRLYKIWRSMIGRCFYKSTNSFDKYGGKGVTVCNEWKNSFIAFRDWALNNGYADDLSIDRINFNGNYDPFNCRWASKIQQDNNRSSNVNLTIDGVVHTISEWARIAGISKETIRSRIRSGKNGVELIKKTKVDS